MKQKDIRDVNVKHNKTESGKNTGGEREIGGGVL